MTREGARNRRPPTITFNVDPVTPAADLLPDPLAQFALWLDEARAAGVEMPEAMTLATADAAGRPSKKFAATSARPASNPSNAADASIRSRHERG